MTLAFLAGSAAAQSTPKAPAKEPSKAAPAPAATPAQEATPDQPAKPEAKIEGFRAATFGMTETQVRAAIRKDFNLSGEKVVVEENPGERTTSMTITVDEQFLMPESGPAHISYVLGFKSKKLFQINVVWGAPFAPNVPAEKLVATANDLLQYFLGSSTYAADSVVVNAKTTDGTVIVFKGGDAQKRTVLLRLITTPPAKEGDKPALTMVLSYVLDLASPDIFRIPKGQF